MEWRKLFTWQNILIFAAALKLLSDAMAGFFGINLIGKKIYKGAPAIWKWIIRGATHRREMDQKMNTVNTKLDVIVGEVSYNGGSSTKDAVKRIEAALGKISSTVDFNALRLESNDIINDRMTFQMDNTGALITINEIFLKKFGYTEEDLQGYAWENILADPDRLDAIEKWKRAIITGSRFFDEQTIYNSSGEPFQVCVRGFPQCDLNKKVIKFHGTIEIIGNGNNT